MPTNQVDLRVTVTGAEAAAKVLQSVAAAGGQIGSIMTSNVREASREIDSLGSVAKRTFEIFTGVSLANIFVLGAEKVRAMTVEILHMGAEARVAEESFRLVAQSVKVSSDALSASMAKAADGLVNQSDTMLAAARALQQGLQPDQIVGLMEIARAQAKLAGTDVTTAFNSITQAVTAQQVRALKQFGIIVDLNKAYEEHATRLGTVAAALTEEGQSRALGVAVIERMRGKLVETNSQIISEQEEFQRFKISIIEAGEAIGKNLIANLFAAKQALEDLGGSAANSSWVQAYFDLFKRLDEFSGHPNSAGLAQAITLSPDDLAELRGAPDLMDDLADTSNQAAGQVDRVKDALFRAEQVVKDLQLAQQLGTGTAVQLAAGLQSQVAALRALGDTSPDVINKIRELQSQGAALQKTFEAAVAGIRDAFRTLSEEVGRGVLPVDAFTAMNAPLDQFRDKLRDQLAQLGFSKSAIQELDATLAALQQRLIDQVDAFRQANEESKAFVEAQQENAQTAARAYEAAQFSLDKWLASVQAGDARLAELNGVPTAAEAYAELRENIDSAAKSYAAIQDAIDKTDQESQDFVDALEVINIQAALLGNRFDGAGAQIVVMQQRLVQLARDAHGRITPEMEALGAALRNAIDANRLQEALGLARTVFDDFVDAARQTAQAMTQAFSDLFFDVFTGQLHSIADAFKQFGLSLLRTLTDFMASQVTKQFLGFLASDFGGGGGTNGAGAAVGGVIGFGNGFRGVGAGAGDVGSAGAGGGGGSGIFGMIQSLFSGGQSLLAAPSILTPFISAWQTFSASLALGEGTFGALTSGASAFYGTLQSVISSMGPVTMAAAGLADILAVVTNAFDIAHGNLGKGIGGLVGGGIGAGVGALLGFGLPGALVGFGLGDLLGSLIGGLFEHQGQYLPKRQQALEEAQGGLASLSGVYSTAARSGNLAQVLAALQTTEGARGAIRADLVLPADIAAQLGITGAAVTGGIRPDLGALSTAQFGGILAAYRQHPELLSLIQGSGDVGYLPQAQAEQVAAQVKQSAISMIQAFNAFQDLTDTIDQQGEDVRKAVYQAFPADLAQRFNATVLTPIHDEMLRVAREAPGDQIAAQLDVLDKRLQQRLTNWSTFAATYQQQLDAIALMPGGAGFTPPGQPRLPGDTGGVFDPTHGLTGFALGAWNKLQPEFDKLINLLATGTQQEIDAQEQRYQALVAGWSKLGAALVQIDGEIAGLTHDVPAQATAIVGQIGQLDRTVADAQTAYQRALEGGNVTDVADAAQRLHDAVMNRYQTELQLEQQVRQHVIDTRQALIQGLQTAIAKAKEWHDAAASTRTFVATLAGTVSGNPLQSLAVAQQQFQAALAAYQAHPSAQALATLQQLAQTVLQIAGPLFSEPSAQFQQLAASIEQQLLAAAALADQQADYTQQQLDTMQAQLDALQALQDASGPSLALLQQQYDEAVALQAELQHLGVLTDDANADQQRLADQAAELLAQIRDGILHFAGVDVTPVTQAIDEQTAMMAAQTALLGTISANTSAAALGQYVSHATIEGVTGSFWWDRFIFFDVATQIQNLRRMLGLPQAAAGMERVPHDMPVYVHAGEAILPPREAQAYRTGLSTAHAPMPDRTSGGTQGRSQAVTLSIAPGAIVISGVSDPKAAAAMAMQAIEDSVRRGRLGRMIEDRAR